MTRKTAAREERILAKPLVQSGVLKQPGETVRLRPDQIARLEAGGHFEPVKAKAAGAKAGKTGDSTGQAAAAPVRAGRVAPETTKETQS